MMLRPAPPMEPPVPNDERTPVPNSARSLVSMSGCLAKALEMALAELHDAYGSDPQPRLDALQHEIEQALKSMEAKNMPIADEMAGIAAALDVVRREFDRLRAG